MIKKPGIGRLVVELQEDDEVKSKGGIFLSAAKEKFTQKTKIISVGDTKGKYNPGDCAYIPADIGIPLGCDELAILGGDILYVVETNAQPLSTCETNPTKPWEQ
jgi:hypothetical protein